MQHYVYTSVGSADRNTGIPHFDDKWRIAAACFTNAERLNDVEFDIARRSADHAGNGGRARQGARPEDLLRPDPLEDVRKNSEDFALMLDWFDRVGYDADIDGTAREFGVKPTRLDAWAATLGA